MDVHNLQRLNQATPSSAAVRLAALEGAGRQFSPAGWCLGIKSGLRRAGRYALEDCDFGFPRRQDSGGSIPITRSIPPESFLRLSPAKFP